MTIAALLVWMCTAAAGGYLLATRARSADAGPAAEPEPQPAPVAAAAQTRRAKDRFDPPSLVRAKNEPLPGMRALAEFAHPALAITGFAFWAAYLLTGDRVFGVIELVNKTGSNQFQRHEVELVERIGRTAGDLLVRVEN